MKSVPDNIARMVVLNHIHPVRAWRDYYHLSKKTLAHLIGMSEYDIEKIESSNLHLKPAIMKKLISVFHISPDMIKIRYHNLTHHT